MPDHDALYWSYAEGYARGRLGLTDPVSPAGESIAAAAFLLGFQDGREALEPRPLSALRADASRLAA